MNVDIENTENRYPLQERPSNMLPPYSASNARVTTKSIPKTSRKAWN
jgi:hypothetical protein